MTNETGTQKDIDSIQRLIDGCSDGIKKLYEALDEIKAAQKMARSMHDDTSKKNIMIAFLPYAVRSHQLEYKASEIFLKAFTRRENDKNSFIDEANDILSKAMKKKE